MQLDAGVLDGLRQLNAAGLAEGDRAAERVWLLGGQVCLAHGTADGKKGCVTIPFLGVPIKLCWELLDIDVTPPGVSLKAKLTVSVGGSQFFSMILQMKCTDIAKPGTCTVSVENQLAANAALSPSCDWSCLGTCAPACIFCGKDYWCWAKCAAGCVLKCCHLW